jgi:hypothetical protein
MSEVLEVPCSKKCAKNKNGYCSIADYIDIFGDDLCLMQGYFMFGMRENDKCILQVEQ